MGKRTSVYLTDAQEAAMKAAGLTMAEVVRRGLALSPRESARARVAGKPHGDPDHACSWACPQSDPLADVRAVSADIGAGLTAAEIHERNSRPGPFSFGPDVPAFMDPLATPGEVAASLDPLAQQPDPVESLGAASPRDARHAARSGAGYGQDNGERPNDGWSVVPGPDDHGEAAFLDEVLHEPGAPDLTALAAQGLLGGPMHSCCKHCPTYPHPSHPDPCRQGCANVRSGE